MMSLKKSRDKIKKAMKKSKAHENSKVVNDADADDPLATVNILTGTPSVDETNNSDVENPQEINVQND